MTPREKQRTIAEYCGWTHIEESGRLDGQLVGWRTDGLMKLYEVPDYFNDLNAMHQAEKRLTEEQREVYYCELYGLQECTENCGPAEPDGPDIMIASNFSTLHATYAQRAEAFLKTIYS